MGLEISIELLTLVMFGSLVALLMAGLPLAFVTGGLACVFLFVLGDARAPAARIHGERTPAQLGLQVGPGRYRRPHVLHSCQTTDFNPHDAPGS